MCTRRAATGSMAEWLRRLIRNQLGVARGSSNLSAVAFFVPLLRIHLARLLVLLALLACNRVVVSLYWEDVSSNPLDRLDGRAV